MNTTTRLMLASLCLLLLAPSLAWAQDGGMVSSDDILKQLEKKPEPETGKSRSFRGIRINKVGDDKAQAAQPAQQAAPQADKGAEPGRDMAQTAPAEKPSVTVYLYFQSGSAELAGEHSKKQLAALGKALSSPALAGAVFEIGGHTDSQGSEAANQTLSEQRAANIRDLLVKSYGVSADRVTAKGYGESQPVASNDAEAGRAKNRRVVIKRLD